MEPKRNTACPDNVMALLEYIGLDCWHDKRLSREELDLVFSVDWPRRMEPRGRSGFLDPAVN